MKYYIHMLILWCVSIAGQQSQEPALVQKAQEVQCKMFDENIRAIKSDIQNRLVKSLKTPKWNFLMRRRLKSEVESLQAQLEQMKRDRQLRCPAALNE